MRAAVNLRYGPPEVLRIIDVPDPVPGADQVLVRVRSAAVTAADARIRAARFPRGFTPFARLAFGFTRPRRTILGSAFAGVVTAVGTAVTDLHPGERVAGMTGIRFGAHAEQLAVDRSRITTIPDAVDDDQAAGVLFGGSTALHYLVRRAGITAGQKVLVIGGSGAVGSNAVQLAADLGAHVTAVTGPDNLELARELGAKTVIDHRTTDITGLTDRFDVVLDTVGVLSSRTGKALLTPAGKLQLAVADLWQTATARGRVQAGSSSEKAEDFAHLLDLVAAKRLRAVVDRTVDLDGMVEAHRRVDSGRKVGNILLHP